MADQSRASLTISAAFVVAATLIAAPGAQAQKIVCWKDKTGKVVGCGDRVPPEFRENEAKILDNRGLPRGTKVSAEEAARQKEEEKKKAVQKIEEDRRIAEQRRQDSALINTYTSGKEIDQRRDRELQVVELQIIQLKASLKSATEAYLNAQKRNEGYTKIGKPAPDIVRDELSRTSEEKNRIESRIAEKEKDTEVIRNRYDEQKKRYFELKGLPAETPGAGTAAKK